MGYEHSLEAAEKKLEWKKQSIFAVEAFARQPNVEQARYASVPPALLERVANYCGVATGALFLAEELGRLQWLSLPENQGTKLGLKPEVASRLIREIAEIWGTTPGDLWERIKSPTWKSRSGELQSYLQAVLQTPLLKVWDGRCGSPLATALKVPLYRDLEWDESIEIDFDCPRQRDDMLDEGFAVYFDAPPRSQNFQSLDRMHSGGLWLRSLFELAAKNPGKLDRVPYLPIVIGPDLLTNGPDADWPAILLDTACSYVPQSESATRQWIEQQLNDNHLARKRADAANRPDLGIFVDLTDTSAFRGTAEGIVDRISEHFCLRTVVVLAHSELLPRLEDLKKLGPETGVSLLGGPVRLASAIEYAPPPRDLKQEWPRHPALLVKQDDRLEAAQRNARDKVRAVPTPAEAALYETSSLDLPESFTILAEDSANGRALKDLLQIASHDPHLSPGMRFDLMLVPYDVLFKWVLNHEKSSPLNSGFDAVIVPHIGLFTSCKGKAFEALDVKDGDLIASVLHSELPHLWPLCGEHYGELQGLPFWTQTKILAVSLDGDNVPSRTWESVMGGDGRQPPGAEFLLQGIPKDNRGVDYPPLYYDLACLSSLSDAPGRVNPEDSRSLVPEEDFPNLKQFVRDRSVTSRGISADWYTITEQLRTRAGTACLPFSDTLGDFQRDPNMPELLSGEDVQLQKPNAFFSPPWLPGAPALTAPLDDLTGLLLGSKHIPPQPLALHVLALLNGANEKKVAAIKAFYRWFTHKKIQERFCSRSWDAPLLPSVRRQVLRQYGGSSAGEMALRAACVSHEWVPRPCDRHARDLTEPDTRRADLIGRAQAAFVDAIRDRSADYRNPMTGHDESKQD